MQEQGWLRMEKIDTDYTQQNWKILAKLFKLFNHDIAPLRWVNTVFDTCVSFNFLSKTLDPLVAKNGSKQINNTNFGFW